jgi:hypothetical protein
MKRLLVLLMTLCLWITCSFIGCHKAAPAHKSSAPPKTEEVVVSQPLRISGFIDQTTSMAGARVVPVTAASFAPVYERLAVSGGELAVGLIRDDSNRPFARLFIPAPPAAPAAGPLPPNVFDAAAVRNRQNAARLRYEEKLRARREEIARRQADFERSIAPLLARRADAQATDIYSALRRADVFLSEPSAFGRATRNVVILVSDGIETVADGAPPRMNASAEILLVNGAGEIGSLAGLAPVRFESLDAALRYLIEGGAHVRR